MAETRALRWPPLVVVGVTGGIASGKSTVCRMLAECGARVLNADDVGREVVAPGEPALAELLAAFGRDYLAPDGTLRRRELGTRVFRSPRDLATLNRITHPRIGQCLAARLRDWQTEPLCPPIIALEAAVLIEAGWTTLVDRVLVVTAQHSTQIARLMGGLGLSQADAAARVHAQLSPRLRLRHADYPLVGDLPLPEVQQQVERIWRDLSHAAGRPSPSLLLDDLEANPATEKKSRRRKARLLSS